MNDILLPEKKVSSGQPPEQRQAAGHRLRLHPGRLAASLGLAVLSLLAGPLTPRAAALEACPAGVSSRSYHVVAMQTRIVFNRWGDHDPSGLIYALKENQQIILDKVAANPNAPVEEVQPLVIRANAGDCVQIVLENSLPFNVGITPHGLSYDPNTSDGAAFGRNQDSTVPPGGTRTYVWQTPDHEGTHVFSDLGNALSGDTGSNMHGLFGALIVEPAGSTWSHPVTGQPINSGLFADIHPAGAPSFREYVTIFHDEPEVYDQNGLPPSDPVTGLDESTMPINYRSEPARNRIRYLQENPAACPECVGEEVSLSSWPFGDPAKHLVPRAYAGDPSKFRVINAGIKETHVYHLHTHQWRMQPDDPNSTIIDSIQISPQTAYNVVPLFGAGSKPESFGDTIWHCHLYPHFGQGMWGLWRVYDKLEDGSQTYPDGTQIPALQPLPDRTPPPGPTPAAPGFPNFVPGTFGRKSPQPPLFDVNSPRQPTPQELASSQNPNPRPGAFFVEPCPAGAPKRYYDLVAIQVPIQYNKQGWHDPEGRILVVAEDEAAVRAGTKPPEPLFIRAAAGECVEINFTNKLPRELGGNAFQPKFITNEAGLHIHLVKFDVLNSDGTSNGWNYDESSQHLVDGQYQTVHYTWYADTELQTVFFHDHLFANLHQQHGYYAALVVEPPGSRFLHPQTQEEIKSGTQAVIQDPNGPDFREFALAVQDFTYLYDANGIPINPPDVSGSFEDPGVMAINYRNEPLQFRTGRETGYALSSHLHGDPGTPVFRALGGDPIRMRMIQGAHEESHILNINGVRWQQAPFQSQSPYVAAQSVGLSEAFNMVFDADIDDGYTRDHLYWMGGIDDFWLGLWGLIRVHTGQPADLPPLPDRQPLSVAIPADDMKVFQRPEQDNPGGLYNHRPPARQSGNVNSENHNEPGVPCPAGAPVRSYSVVAMPARIQYNAHGDHDPYGLIFALAEDEAAILNGKNPEPLVLRANQGDCVEVILTNKITSELPAHAHPEVPVQTPFPFSKRVGLHAQVVQYDVRGSDGTAVGYNPDSSVSPGRSRLYRWYADAELGSANVWSMTDMRNHRHHGLWAGLIVEPAGSTWLDPATMAPLQTGTQAVIRTPGRPDFREFVLFAQDGVPLLDANGVTVELPADPAHAAEPPDPEDEGMKGINYRAERFAPRLATDPSLHLVFSSLVHGDPATPVFKTYAGDPVTVRLLMPADKPRNHSFTIHGHQWRDEPGNPSSSYRSEESSLSVGSAVDMQLHGGAGGLWRMPGDYAYRSGNIRWDLEMGMWGIMRVFNALQPGLSPLQ